MQQTRQQQEGQQQQKRQKQLCEKNIRIEGTRSKEKRSRVELRAVAVLDDEMYRHWLTCPSVLKTK